MKVAYLLASYPMTSTTFIRREIHALEARGVEIQRFAVRVWDQPLVDPIDQQEREKTKYLLTGNSLGLLVGFFKELAINPLGMIKGLKLAFQLQRQARGDIIKHIAYFLQAISFRQHLSSTQIKHVHVHFATNATTVAMLCHVMGGPGYSFMAHGPDEFVDPTRLGVNFKMKYAAFIVAITHFCKVQLARFGGVAYWNKTHIMHCALDMTEFPAEQVCLPGEGEGQHTFICVGRLCEAKAQVLIPDAIAPLVQAYPDLKVILVGDGPTRQAIEAKIQALGLEKHIHLVGWKVNAAVREMIQGARALLLPSFAEGLPVVIMEALAMQRPVITTYIAGIPELVDADCGWIVPAGDVEGVTASLRACLEASPTELVKMGQIGRQRVIDRHNLDQLAIQLEEKFQQAIDQAIDKVGKN